MEIVASTPDDVEPVPVVEPPAPAGSAAPDEPAPTSWARRIHGAAPLVVGLPALVALGVWVARVVAVRHPNLGWATTIASDAKAVAHGSLLYGDPAEGYTGMLYAPGYPLVLAPLYRVFWWDGWPLLVTALSSLVTAAVAGWYGAGAPARRERLTPWAVSAGVGVTGLAWWLAVTNPRNMVFEARGDNLAWMAAVLGLVAAARVVSGRSTRWWPVVVWLTAAVWTKQTTVGVVAAVLLGTVWFAATKRHPWRSAARLVALVGGVNVVVLAVVMLATDGWARYFLLELPSRHAVDPQVRIYVDEFVRLFAFPFLLVVGAVVTLALSVPSRGRAGGRRAEPPSLARATLTLVPTALVCSLLPAVAGRRKQGGEINQYIGMFWLLALVLGVAYGLAPRRRRATVAAVVTVAVATATAFVPSVRNLVERSSVDLAAPYPPPELPAVGDALVSYAEEHRLYNPWASDLNAGSFGEDWPTVQNIVDLLAAGEQPGHLVDALLDRHFDAVVPFDVAADPYASAWGRREENYLWKLNRVIASGYRAVPGTVPRGLLLRRDEPLEPWLATCFAPFDLGGATWEIGLGGGLWCTGGVPTGVIDMRGTPTPFTELRTEGPVRVSGELLLTAPSGAGAVEAIVPGGGSVHVMPSSTPGTVVVTTRDIAGLAPQFEMASAVPPGEGFGALLRFGEAAGPAEAGLQVPVTDEPGVFAVRATQESAARIDLRGLRLTPG